MNPDLSSAPIISLVFCSSIMQNLGIKDTFIDFFGNCDQRLTFQGFEWRSESLRYVSQVTIWSLEPHLLFLYFIPLPSSPDVLCCENLSKHCLSNHLFTIKFVRLNLHFYQKFVPSNRYFHQKFVLSNHVIYQIHDPLN